MTVKVTAAWGALTSNLTLDPKLLTAANWFLSAVDWPRTKTLKQATRKTILITSGRCFKFFIGNLPNRRDTDLSRVSDSSLGTGDAEEPVYEVTFETVAYTTCGPRCQEF
jgi:hypothetical protein